MGHTTQPLLLTAFSTQKHSCLSLKAAVTKAEVSCKHGCRQHPPVVESAPALQQWMCEVHNEVNQDLQKPKFNCNFVTSRWGALECGEELACSLDGRKS